MVRVWLIRHGQSESNAGLPSADWQGIPLTELGHQQALLGMQQQDASREADRKMQSLIDQAMKNGKAQPAQ